MKLVITFDLPGTEAGTPDPLMARKVVDGIRMSGMTGEVVRAISRVERETQSTITLGRMSVAVERNSPTVYRVTE